jgi:hypothetical protein
MRLRVQYDRPEELLADNEAQFQRGGVLVRIEPPAGLALFETVELEIATGFAGTLVLSGQVVQIVPGAGVAVTFDPSAVLSLVEAARGGEPAAEEPSPPRPKPVANDIAKRIHSALYGAKEERWRVLRDVNKMLHPYVLRNTGLGLDEVLAIAKMNTVAPELLGTIAERREWAQRPDIAIALVRNPKTPTAAAIRLLDYVSAADLRHLAKDSHTRPAVQQAARKKVIG